MSDDPDQDWLGFDKQIEFFLERQSQILEWANLAAEAQEAARRKLETLRIDAHDIGQGWVVGSFDPGQKIVGPAVFRPSWCVTRPEVPDVAAAVSFDGSRVDPAGLWPNTSLPYVGVRCDLATDTDRKLTTYLKEQLAIPARYRWRKGINWPIYCYVEADPDWWRHLAEWAAGIVRLLADMANEYDSAIEDALEGVKHR